MQELLSSKTLSGPLQARPSLNSNGVGLNHVGQVPSTGIERARFAAQADLNLVRGGGVLLCQDATHATCSKAAASSRQGKRG
jgi:hypothetical protein